MGRSPSVERLERIRAQVVASRNLEEEGAAIAQWSGVAEWADIVAVDARSCWII